MFSSLELHGKFPTERVEACPERATHIADDGHARVDPHMPACLRGKGGPAVKSYPSKTDYHPLAACYEVLQVTSKNS